MNNYIFKLGAAFRGVIRLVAIGHFIFVAGMILEAEEMEIEEARGTHGGRLLTESDFTVEPKHL